MIKDDFFAAISTPMTFRRVIMPLSALVAGEFFNEYIKKGKVKDTATNLGFICVIGTHVKRGKGERQGLFFG
jgi:hypothetical protein